MSFAIISLVNSCRHIEDLEFVKNHRVALIADALLLASIALVAGLILGGVIHIGIPIGAGTLSNAIVWGIVAGVGAAAVFDIVFLIKHLLHKRAPAEVANNALSTSVIRNKETTETQPRTPVAIVPRATVPAARGAIFRPFAVIKSLFAPRRDYLTQLPFELFTHILTFLSAKDINNLRRVSQSTKALVEASDISRALRGAWFKLGQNTKDQQYMSFRHSNRRHFIYLKLDDSKKSTLAYYYIDEYPSDSVLEGTYRIDYEIRAFDNDHGDSEVPIVRFRDKTYWIEAKEWRVLECTDNEPKKCFSTWGKYLESDDDIKIKRLFYDIFAENGQSLSPL